MCEERKLERENFSFLYSLPPIESRVVPDVNTLRHMLSISGIVDFGEKKKKRCEDRIMSQKKRSIADGLGAMALGSVLTTGGVAAGVTAAASAASQVKLAQQASGDLELVSIDLQKLKSFLCKNFAVYFTS